MQIDVEALLCLSAVPGVGPTRLRALIGRFKTPEAVFKASVRDLVTVEGIDQITARKIKTSTDGGFAKDQLSRLNKHLARVVTFWDSEYPENLRKIYDPPAFLFVKGNLQKEDKYSIGVVGTRSPSAYGKLIAEKICGELAQWGITVVSGMARGIDTLCHWGALKAGGRTVAILGSGLDVIYPNENRGLAKEIVARGALVSEFPMGTEPDAPNFPRRNRIICGMSLGTVVIEAGERSGALLTAAMALEQNREVYAVPGNINSPKSVGTNRLIKEGAKLVQSVEDIFAELGPQLNTHLKKGKLVEPKVSLTAEERKLLESLSEEPLHIDVIAQKNGLPTSRALATLLSLELKDVVKQLAGKVFIRM